MMVGVLIDNDVIIKLSAYELGQALVDATSLGELPPSMLSVGRFVVRDRLARAGRIAGSVAALSCFERLLPELQLIDPTDQEIAMAADFEDIANRYNLELDGGESQLLAILLARAAGLLITGDKRAIRAIATVAAAPSEGRVACLEQLIATIVGQVGGEAVRAGVCREPAADKAVTICFGCESRQAPAAADILAALESYIDHIRRDACGVLLTGWDVSALAA
jgi:predicted nucleic acid-binding protein